MICPVCQFDNFEGSDECENCGADLRSVDVPRPETPLERQLVVEHLSELGHREPIVLPAEASVGEAVAAMQAGKVGSVLVLEVGRLAGIFTERDALLRMAGRALATTPLGDVMTRDPVVLREDDSIAVAIHKMAVGGFRHIPLVAEDGHVSGIVTAQDVMRHILQLLG